VGEGYTCKEMRLAACWAGLGSSSRKAEGGVEGRAALGADVCGIGTQTKHEGGLESGGSGNAWHAGLLG